MVSPFAVAFTGLTLAAVAAAPAQGGDPEMRATVVELSAVVSDNSPRVTLHWSAGHFPPTGITVYRREMGASNWGAGTTLSESAVSYPDTTAAANVLYEYKVVRTQDSVYSPTAEGHLWSGVKIPAIENRGRLILVVDDSMTTALVAEIARLYQDLIGDGWTVARTDVSRSATVGEVKDAIHGRYQEDPVNSRAVLLLGRVPVPYSGIICPDGHHDPPPDAHHRGAWPADVYYGDMDGEWTDTSVDYSVANVDGTRNANVPGDGKFDQSLIVGGNLPEMVVGRVDLANMGGVANGVSETELLRRYLDRLHRFRHRLHPFTTLGERALIDDNFGSFFGLGFAASGWASGIALFGSSQTSAQDWMPTLRDHDYLVAYGCGPGSFNGAGGVSSIHDFRETRSRAVIHLLFGSFFGDWDSADNYLRAPLVGTPESHGLVSVWSGHPRWQLFPLAAGGTMADAYHHVIGEVNLPGGPFPPDDDSWTNPDQTHVAIMGDPVLRLQPVKPVTNLGASVNGSGVILNWTNPEDETDLQGCRIYRGTSATGPFARIGGQTAAGAESFVDAAPGAGTHHYMVRAIKLQTTAAASYENPAQGVFTSVTVPANGFAAWAAGLNDPSEAGDPNGDGVPNLVAYAIGADDGNENALGKLPRIDPDGSITLDQSDRADVHYEFQLSAELIAWFTVAGKTAGGSWSLNAASGYPHQGNITLIGATAKTVADTSVPVKRFWRLKTSL